MSCFFCYLAASCCGVVYLEMVEGMTKRMNLKKHFDAVKVGGGFTILPTDLVGIVKPKASYILFIITLLLFVVGCGKDILPSNKNKIVGYDDLKRKIEFSTEPQRVILLTGSPIDAIIKLGAGNKIVGIIDNLSRSYPETCKRYPSLLKIPGIGRWDNPNIETIIALKPDLIICHGSLDKPGKYSAVFEKYGLPYAVFSSVKSIEFGFEQIDRLGKLLNREKKAQKLIKKIKNDIKEVTSYIKPRIKEQPLVYYWWGSGNGTYGNMAAIHELIETAGGINLAGEFNKGYMELSSEYILDKNPDIVLISYWKDKQRVSGIENLKKRPGFQNIKAVKENRIHLIDGHSFHTPVRFAEVIREFAEYFHPELFVHDKGKKDL